MSLRNLTILALAIILSACGFTPIAAPTLGTDSRARIELSDLTITVESQRDSERFRYLITRALQDTTRLTDESSLDLKLHIRLSREGLAIEQNDTVTRLNYTAEIDYSLSDNFAVEVLAGSAVSITALNATASQFSTSVSERDALNRLATDISNRISLILRLYYDEHHAS